MHWRNTVTAYGLLSIGMHWLVALAVFGLFGLGLWMVDLDYYSSWRHTAPELHKGIGLCLFALMLLRLLWRFVSPPPASLSSYSRLTRLGAKLGHSVLYLGLFAVMLAGYLISTADGRGISVFGWFDVPASHYQHSRAGRCRRCGALLPGLGSGDPGRSAWPGGP